MIKTNKEYKNTLQFIEDINKTVKLEEKVLKEDGLSKDEIRMCLDPTKFFFQLLVEEVKEYEKSMEIKNDR